MGLLRDVYERHLARHLKRFSDDYAREALYGTVFNAAVARLDWLDGAVFFPTGAAANYSLLYLYLRVFELVRPKRVLEFGLGQSSILSGAYARHNAEAAIDVVEHDEAWARIYAEAARAAPNFGVRLSPLREKDLSAFGVPGGPRLWYENVPGGAYDLVLLDGPPREAQFGRAGLLAHLPEALAEEFVLVIDDYHSDTIRQTSELVKKRLRAAGRPFSEFSALGLKGQLVLVSPRYAFLSTT